MQFVAYYIETNGFGIKNQTINLGGKYFYTLTKKTKGKLEIHRTPNPKYIPNFYGDKNLTLLSAVVGRNGTGKTSLLIDIIESISGNRGSSNFLIFENNDEVSVFFGNVDNGQGISGNVNWHIETPKNFKLKILNGNIASVYYSPHLDSRAGVPGIDLSFANIIYQDLDEKQDLVRHTNSLNPIKEHEFSNFNRLLTFFNSNLSQKLYESFNLPKPSRIKISFSLIGRVFTDTGYAKLNNFHNMPDEFVEPLNVILGKIETERKNRRGSSFSISAQKERLKHYILWGMLSAIVDVGERDNKYLEEGILPPGFIEKTKDLNAIDTFYYFLDLHYYIPTKNLKSKEPKLIPNPIPKKETEDLFKKLVSVIDSLKAKDEYDNKNFDWHNKCIYPTVNDVTELLVLEAKFTEKLRRYYQPAYKNRESLIDVKPFIHLEWHDRSPSSGENAIFNLFSRLYTIKNEIDESAIKYYILFLDEGDAGFHPEWKKKYIEILTEILPYLFEKDGVEFQIIFTTHDPLTLSDVLKYNIVYFNKKVDDNHTILNYDDKNQPLKSFAANISDLLSDSFFIDEGLIGNFSKKKIQEAIKWLNESEKSNADYYKKLIMNIDEHIVKRKLSEMYDEKMNTDTRKEIIEEQIKELQTLRDKL